MNLRFKKPEGMEIILAPESAPSFTVKFSPVIVRDLLEGYMQARMETPNGWAIGEMTMVDGWITASAGEGLPF